MQTYRSFSFQSYAYDRAMGALALSYALGTAEGGQGPVFREEIIFPAAVHELNVQELEVQDRLFRLLFLLAGVSYYKAFIPPVLKCPAFALDARTAAFCDKVYRNGLGEFAFRNKVTLDFAFEVAQGADAPQAVALQLPDRALVPVGGGKDSIVTIEALKQAGQAFSLFALGGAGALAEPIARTIDVSGKEAVHVRRILSPELRDVNAQGALNGHVPITAILSVIALICAVRGGYDAVVLSNERSANVPNLVCNGQEVNHQYSKSLAFEQDLSAYLRDHVAGGLRYFSLLRPLSETAIARAFAAHTAYHDVFRSCNTAFRQEEKTRGKNWCCACPKCRFVFLALAPFMEKEKLVALFGKNLLDDPAQLEGYKELCGVQAFKPFECVGEIEESAALMAHLVLQPAWQNDIIVAQVKQDLKGQSTLADTFEKLLQAEPSVMIPEKYKALVQ